MALGGFVLLFAVRLVLPMLHGISAFDPLTVAGVSMTLLLITCIAATLPAMRAATLDPIDALRA
jgi:ABC-type lipoprotein release transport system permease subunit